MSNVPNRGWGPGNPAWEAFHGGQFRIEQQLTDPNLPTHYYDPDNGMPQPPHGTPENTHLVRRSVVDPGVIAALKEQGIIPRRSAGNQSVAVNDAPAGMADVEYAYAKNLIAYATVQNPDITPVAIINGVSVQPALSQAPAGGPPVIGGIIAVAELRFGHDGCNQTVLFDVPPGAIVKVPIAGSAARLNGRLVPKFYTNNDNLLVANKRVYLVAPGGVQLTNAQFNQLPQNIMTINGITNANPTPFQGFFADGALSNGDQFSKPTRRFYGSVKTGAAALTQDTLVPVAWPAVAVQVTGGLGPTPAGGAAITLQFNQNGPVGSAGAGPFPLNTIVPLIDNCQSLEIFQNAAAAAGQEVPFEVIYYLSF